MERRTKHLKKMQVIKISLSLLLLPILIVIGIILVQRESKLSSFVKTDLDEKSNPINSEPSIILSQPDNDNLLEKNIMATSTNNNFEDLKNKNPKIPTANPLQSSLIRPIPTDSDANNSKSSQPLSSPFEIHTRTNSEINGLLKFDSLEVEFASYTENSSTVLTHINMGDFILDATAELTEDKQKKVVIIDGYGKALTVDYKKALIELSRHLQRSLRPNKGQLLQQEDLLLRLVLYWSEAPVGFPLTKQVVPSPETSSQRR